MNRHEARYQIMRLVPSPDRLRQGERSAFWGLARDVQDPAVRVDQLEDFAYSIDDPLGAKIREILKELQS